MFNFWLTLIAISLLPLIKGGVPDLAVTAFSLVIGMLLVSWAVSRIASNCPAPVSMSRLLPIVLPFALLVVWILFQALVSVSEPYVNPYWSDANRILASAPKPTVATSPEVTLEALLRLLAFGGVFLLALQTCRDRTRAFTALMFITLVVSAYAAYGIIAELTDGTRILWFEKERFIGRLTSTFRVPNSFATLAGLGVLSAFTLLWRVGDRNRFLFEPDYPFAMRVKMFIFESGGWPPVLALILCGSALLLTDSRGGLSSAILGFGTLIGLLALAYRFRIHGVLLLTVGCIAGALALGALGFSSETIDRLDDAGNDFRLRVYELSAEGIMGRPLTGYGFGSFGDTFRAVRPNDIPVNHDRAHNSYLEAAWDLGIPGALMLIAPIAIIAAIQLRGLRARRRDMFYPALGLSTIMLVGTHSLVDFSVQIPGFAVFFCYILGLTTAQSWPSKNSVNARFDESNSARNSHADGNSQTSADHREARA